MSNNTPKKVSLEQLYTQRKANHTLPNSMREQLRKQAHTLKSKKRVRWQIAVPIAFASLMTVVVIYPGREQLNEEKNFATIMQSAPLTSTSSESPMSLALEDEVTAETAQADKAAVYKTASREANETAPAIKSLAKAAPPSSEVSLEAEINEIVSSDGIEQSDTPLILLVTQGKQGLFENCTGEEVKLDAETELVGWVSATLLDEQWHIKVFDLKQKPCSNE
jgi:hypothetical protein